MRLHRPDLPKPTNMSDISCSDRHDLPKRVFSVHGRGARPCEMASHLTFLFKGRVLPSARISKCRPAPICGEFVIYSLTRAGDFSAVAWKPS